MGALEIAGCVMLVRRGLRRPMSKTHQAFGHLLGGCRLRFKGGEAKGGGVGVDHFTVPTHISLAQNWLGLGIHHQY